MKQKIFEKLKQAYSSLGLGDVILSAHSEALAGTNFVTDENIDAVVASQKAFLESLQKSNDKRVAEAIASANAKSKKDSEAEIKRLTEELAALKGAKQVEGMPDWYKTEKEASEKQMKELLETNKKLMEGLTGLQSENKAMKEAAAQKARMDSIIAKAKELGIPQYRIDEGFMIAPDADESAITEVLTKVSNNIKAQSLPNRGGAFTMDMVEKPADADVAAVVKAMSH